MFKTGQENGAADALSWQNCEGNSSSFALSVVQPTWLQGVKQSVQEDQGLQVLISDLANDSQAHPGYEWYNDILTYKGKLVVGKDKVVRSLIFY